MISQAHHVLHACACAQCVEIQKVNEIESVQFEFNSHHHHRMIESEILLGLLLMPSQSHQFYDHSIKIQKFHKWNWSRVLKNFC